MMIDNIIQWFQTWLPFNMHISLLFFTAVFIATILVFAIMAINALAAVYAERKVSAFMQDRIGPMGQGPGLHAGKWGLLQTVADALKLLLKEDIIPAAADKKIFIIAPFIIFLGAFIALAAVPFGPQLIVADMNIGIFYILAVSSFGIIGMILAAWSSDNKWSLFGGMRSAAQIISYEIPAALSLVSVLMLASTLSMQGIIQSQSGTNWGILPNWNIFNNPFTFLACFIYFIAGVAETNRTPFDIPEAESELVAGFHTEYSGMRWAFFFLSEYGNMLVVCGITVVAFLGGWQSPIDGRMTGPLWGIFWFLTKLTGAIFIMIWFRWTFPRLRVDQLMNIAWKILLPIALFNLFGVGIWTLLVN